MNATSRAVGLARQAHRTGSSLSRRKFFASSTDHTTLLKEAEIHKFQVGDDGTQYVLAASGLDPVTVKSVPQLHLSRLMVKDEAKGSDGGNLLVFQGARVVQRTLGSTSQVCQRLLEAALADVSKENRMGEARAYSSLHGLSDWVVNGGIEKLGFDSDEAVAAVLKDMAKTTSCAQYDTERWEQLAKDYISLSLGEESSLYTSNGGKLESIRHQEDTSEFANTCGGAIAVFRFSE